MEKADEAIEQFKDELLWYFTEYVQRLDEAQNVVKEQLCWTCQNACGDCSWSSCFQPVEGWTAENVHRKTYDSYRITKCPEYVPDKKA